MSLLALFTRLATPRPTPNLSLRPLQLGLLTFALNIPIYLALKLCLWATVGTLFLPTPHTPLPTLLVDESSPWVTVLFTVLLGPILETFLMLLLYELLHAACRLPPWAAALPVVLMAAWAHSGRGLFTLLPTFFFAVLIYEYILYRRLQGGAAGAVAVFLTHATNNALATALVLGVTYW